MLTPSTEEGRIALTTCQCDKVIIILIKIIVSTWNKGIKIVLGEKVSYKA